MNLPFTHEQFIALFANYNQRTWPAQLAAYLLAAGALLALHRAWRHRDALVLSVLALMWAWTGIAYHWLFFSRINQAAVGFAAIFLLQAVLLGLAAHRGSVRFVRLRGSTAWIGIALVAYALLFYPLVGLASGQRYPAMPMFGVAPCPVTIFTIGILLLSERTPWRLLLVPALWAGIGGSAAWSLQVPQDWLLLASGLVLVPVWVLGRREASARAMAAL